jgi:hypothetical protein
MHYYIRLLIQNEATLKWYRAVHFKNLTGWAERRRASRDAANGASVFRAEAASNEKRPRLDRRRFEEASNR